MWITGIVLLSLVALFLIVFLIGFFKNKADWAPIVILFLCLAFLAMGSFLLGVGAYNLGVDDVRITNLPTMDGH